MKVITSRRKQIWLAIASVALVSASAIFFTMQDLSTADQYASVASFFVGLVGLALAALSYLANRTTPNATTPPDALPPSAGTVVNNLNNCDNVQTGTSSTMNVYREILVTAPDKSRRSRK